MIKITITILLLSKILFSSQITMLLTACEEKHAAACEEIGLLYTEGIGFEQNRSKAKHYYKKACEHGSDEACKKLDLFNH